MKKLTAVAMSALLSISLASCSGGETKEAPTENSKAPSASTSAIKGNNVAAECLTGKFDQDWSKGFAAEYPDSLVPKLGADNMKAAVDAALAGHNAFYRDANLLAKEEGDSKPTSADFEFATKHMTKELAGTVQSAVTAAVESGDEAGIQTTREYFPQVNFNTQPVGDLETLDDNCIAFSLNLVSVNGVFLEDYTLVEDELSITTLGDIYYQGTKDGKTVVFKHMNNVDFSMKKEDGAWKIDGAKVVRLAGGVV